MVSRNGGEQFQVLVIIHVALWCFGTAKGDQMKHISNRKFHLSRNHNNLPVYLYNLAALNLP